MAQTTVKLHAAGSLRDAFTEVATAFEKIEGVAVLPVYGASGMLKDRIAAGEDAEVFASANMEHPLALNRAGKAGPVALFARNRLCALTQPTLAVTSATLLDVMLAPSTRLGTSTPKADPGGDYAWEVFHRAERVRPGSFAALDKKALQLTGNPSTPQAPPGRNAYGWLMEEKRADLFLCYCTASAVAMRQVPGLRSIALPPELAVGADYGLTVTRTASPAAYRLALFILSAQGQAILASHGFDAPGRVTEAGE